MKKYYIYIAIAVVLIVAGYLGYRWYKKQMEKANTGGDYNALTQEISAQNQQSTQTSNGNAPAQVLVTTTANDDFPLKLGSKGKKVSQMQAALNSRYKLNPPLETKTGIWGQNTEAALRKLYKKNSAVLISESAWYDIVYQTGVKNTTKPTTTTGLGTYVGAKI